MVDENKRKEILGRIGELKENQERKKKEAVYEDFEELHSLLGRFASLNGLVYALEAGKVIGSDQIFTKNQLLMELKNILEKIQVHDFLNSQDAEGIREQLKLLIQELGDFEYFDRYADHRQQDIPREGTRTQEFYRKLNSFWRDLGKYSIEHNPFPQNLFPQT